MPAVYRPIDVIAQRALALDDLGFREAFMRATPTSRRLTAVPLVALFFGICAAMTATSASAQTGSPSREEIVRYVQQYRGGDCVFIKPTSVAAGAAAIIGYGQQLEVFTQLDDAFKRKFGFEAMIGVVKVTAPQCPAIDVASRFGDRASTLKITLASQRSSEPRTGTVSGFGERRAALLLVSAGGEVHDLSNTLVGTGDARSFSLAPAPAANAKTPQLLIAVSSSGMAEALNIGQGATAEQVFAQLAKAMGTDPGATVEIHAFH
jgi:hypothetical protein